MNLKSAYQISDQWLGQPRPVRVVVIGAGVGGIAAVKLFNETFKDCPTSLVIYEKNYDVGGTWLENRYPG
jgi:cation diffusion facilitator CzcD-associated flavoprotein CzcO